MTTELQEQIDYALRTEDSPTAIKVLGMAKKDPSLDVDPVLLLQLRYIRMNSLSVNQLLDLMDQSILAAYSIEGFDLEQRIKDYLDQIDNVAEEIKFTQNLLKVIDTSEEQLGEKNITVKGNEVKPTIGNWLEDYSTFPSAGKGKDALTEVEYLNKSTTVKTLSEEQKLILKNIIKLYDHTVQAIALWNSIEVPKSEKELYKDYDLYKLIPGLEDDLLEEQEYKKRGSLRPLVEEEPEPQPAPQPIAHKPIPQDLEYIAPAEPKEQHLPPPKNPVHLTDSSELDDMMNRVPRQKMGVVRDPTNIKIADEKQRMDQEQTMQAKRIQQKLSELRKRNTKI